MSGLKNPEPQPSCPHLPITMLSLSFLTLYLAALGAYAKPMVRSATGLEISLSTPADKVKVSELRVVATVKNVRDEDLKVLKLGTVLDNEHPTRSFFVTKDGKQVPFTGVEVCAHSPPSALHSHVLPISCVSIDPYLQLWLP